MNAPTATKKVQSPLPYYIVAGLWFLCAFVVPMYRLSDFLILAAVSIIIYLIAQKFFPGKTVQVKEKIRPIYSGDKTVDAVLAEGRGYIQRLRELNDLIDHERLSAGMDRLEAIGGSIFDYIAKNPEKATKIRRFVNFYLPSTIKMFETYRTMSAQNVQQENIKQTMERIEKTMDTLILAYEKQLDTLFSDEAIDISTDIDVLEGMFAQEGFGGSDFKKQS